MKKLILSLLCILLSAPSLFAQDSTPDWFPNGPEINGVKSVVSNGDGSLEALTSALGNFAESIEQTVLWSENEGYENTSDSAVKWGDIYIITKNYYREIEATEESYIAEGISKTYVLFESEEGKIEFYSKQIEEHKNDDTLYNSEFQTHQENIWQQDLINELYTFGVDITYESTLARSYVMLQIPEEIIPEPLDEEEKNEFMNRINHVLNNGLG